MININFVPDDYVQNNESRRMNFMYIVLFVVVMMALGGVFGVIKMRQRSLAAREKAIDAKMLKKQDDIKKVDVLQTKSRSMMKTALMTAELLEPLPRSVLLASLTNNLPVGVSLVQLNLVQKESKQLRAAAAETATKFDKAVQAQQGQKGAKAAEGENKISPEKLLETQIDIEGLAASDLQVAAYIERLNSSILLENVALVESKEQKIDDVTFRQFKLTAMLKKDVHLTKEDVDKMKIGCDQAARSF
ncbi:MAG: PilN domain-containing protein [Planctomycetota bacterium]|nr:PilN domain-containing protein [Planctomycetota bacterium]